MDTDIKNKLNIIEEKMKESASLRDELKLSIELESMWPEAFDHGPVKAKLVGNFHNPKGMRFSITDGAGNERIWPLSEVPRDIAFDHIDRVPDDRSPFLRSKNREAFEDLFRSDEEKKEIQRKKIENRTRSRRTYA